MMEPEEGKFSDEEWEDYKILVQRVAVVNLEASQYLAYQAPKLDSFRPVNDLDLAFLWGSSFQGGDYWSDIYRELDDMTGPPPGIVNYDF